MYTILQIGANKGATDNDPVWEMCQKNLPESLNYQLCLVEPNPKACDILSENYKRFKNVNIIQKAVSSKSGFIDLYIDNDEKENHYGSQHASVYRSHLLKMGHKESVISSIQVECVTLENIIINNDLKKINYLQIDTEGHDADILLGCNLSNFNIDKIEFEYVHIDYLLLKELNVHLAKHNFIIERYTREDIVMRKKR